MPHVEPAHLMDLALGNDVSNDDPGALQHIAACNRCREELSQVARVVATAREVEESDLPATPPERVWQRITQQLSAASADPRRTRRSTNRHGRTIRYALGLLVGIAFIWWWSRGYGTRPRITGP
ncbi:hypothetical protein [Streptomyces canus]|uniref:hypothetical protein n=1 Tax=Streptomyces canus TaxID=58343 RepID=UPI002E327263|nr:hypothetical protein [Streptomyces canus]